ncbi:MAG: hypothetical protein RSA01_08825 [Clostridium sp.]|uniref:hypothetical protein n=1 Tax=Clostridium sp. TaxID=1506 RepID=UPI002FC64417
MRISNKWLLTIFTIVVTYSTGYINFGNWLKSSSAELYNFNITLVYFLLWIGISVYFGVKGYSKYLKFCLIYFGICFISSIPIAFEIESLTGSLGLPSLWYGSSIYGLQYYFNSPRFICFFIGTVISAITCPLGYYVGSKFKK